MANINIDGLQDFNRDLEKLEDKLPDIAQSVGEEISDIIVRFAKSRVPKGRSGKARSSIQSETKRDIVRVIGGSPRVSYYGWLEFGGTVGRGDSVRRKWERKGRYIYEGYFKNRARLPELLEQATNKGLKEVGLDG